MSNKPSIIFNPDFNRLVLDPLTNKLMTVGEIAKRNNANNAITPSKTIMNSDINTVKKETVMNVPTIIPVKGGYGAVILGRGKR